MTSRGKSAEEPVLATTFAWRDLKLEAFPSLMVFGWIKKQILKERIDRGYEHDCTRSSATDEHGWDTDKGGSYEILIGKPGIASHPLRHPERVGLPAAGWIGRHLIALGTGLSRR